MGWTGIVAKHYKNNKIDRMTEFLDIFNNSKNACNDNVYVVKKARQVGSTIYAACCWQNSKNEDVSDTHGLICLTSVKDGQFYYKDMTESMGPYQSNCPESILSLLSPTVNEYALDWRKRCHNYNKHNKILDKLPVGSVIEIELNGYRVILYKRKYKKITIWWDGQYKYSKNHFISGGYRIIENKAVH